MKLGDWLSRGPHRSKRKQASMYVPSLCIYVRASFASPSLFMCVRAGVVSMVAMPLPRRVVIYRYVLNYNTIYESSLMK